MFNAADGTIVTVAMVTECSRGLISVYLRARPLCRSCRSLPATVPSAAQYIELISTFSLLLTWFWTILMLNLNSKSFHHCYLHNWLKKRLEKTLGL